MHTLGNALGLAWITFGWLLIAWPVTLVLAVVALGAVLRAAESPLALGDVRKLRQLLQERPRRHLLVPSAFTLIVLAWGGAFLTPAIDPPTHLPWHAYVIYAAAFAQVALAAVLVWRVGERRASAAAVLLLQVWVGLVASFVALWAVTSGGTLTAL